MPAQVYRALMAELLRAAEKAADVARILRASKLFDSIVEEKTEEKGKNERFLHDWKTLADVLIQELVRFDLTVRVPGIRRDCVQGEEDSTITNSSGEHITLAIGPTRDDTYRVLCHALDGNDELAQTLAAVAHTSRGETFDAADLDRIGSATFDTDNIGIWIDPIDGTNEYIKGGYAPKSSTGISAGGLEVCTVLIGVYRKSDGVPVAGVIAQPFDENSPGRSRTVWGVADGSVAVFGGEVHDSGDTVAPVIVLSSSESDAIKAACASANREIQYAAGAGYKMLCVINGWASAYILSGNSAFKWDTCAPHAILLAKGGDVVDLHGRPVLYNKPNSDPPLWSNNDGLVAYSDPRLLPELMKIAQSKS